jgi:hypothetical protein
MAAGRRRDGGCGWVAAMILAPLGRTRQQLKVHIQLVIHIRMHNRAGRLNITTLWSSKSQLIVLEFLLELAARGRSYAA